jgi:hypothetical protein
VGAAAEAVVAATATLAVMMAGHMVVKAVKDAGEDELMVKAGDVATTINTKEDRKGSNQSLLYSTGI